MITSQVTISSKNTSIFRNPCGVVCYGITEAPHKAVAVAAAVKSQITTANTQTLACRQVQHLASSIQHRISKNEDFGDLKTLKTYSYLTALILTMRAP